MQKRLNRSRCRLGCGLGLAQGIVLDGSSEVLRDVAMATNFETKIAITGFVRTIATRQLVMEGGLSGRPTECRYCRYLAP